MKVIISIILLLVFNSLYCQVDSTTYQFLIDIINRKSDTTVLIYTEKIHPEMFDNKPYLKKITKSEIVDEKKLIKLNQREYKYIKEQWGQLKNHEWPANLFINSLRIKTDSLAEFLHQDRSRVVYLISKPIFIRNNSIALVHYSRLCCGGIYGPDEVIFYKKENDRWKKWVFVSQGAF